MICGLKSNATMSDPSASSFDPVAWAIMISTFLLVGALLLGAWRLIKGPSTADRIMALDLLTGSVMSATVFLSIAFDFDVFLDVALAIGLVGFLSTAVLARVMEARFEDD